MKSYHLPHGATEKINKMVYKKYQFAFPPLLLLYFNIASNLHSQVIRNMAQGPCESWPRPTGQRELPESISKSLCQVLGLLWLIPAEVAPGQSLGRPKQAQVRGRDA